MKMLAAAVAAATVIATPALAQRQVIDYSYYSYGGAPGFYGYSSPYYAYGYAPGPFAFAPRRSARSAYAYAPRRSARSAYAYAPRRLARSAYAFAPGSSYSAYAYAPRSSFSAYAYAPGQQFPFYSPTSPLPWRPSPFNVFDTTGNYVGSDPDPLVRDQLARDPSQGGGD